MSGRYIMALDEGSSTCRTALVDHNGQIVSEARAALTLTFPRRGWVELDPVGLWQSQLSTMHAALAKADASIVDVAAIGVTTHRETIIMWDRHSGDPVHDGIMWMSRHSDQFVQKWSDDGWDDEIRSRTGLRNDSYFSAGKIAWLLDNVPGARERAQRGELATGTVDSWLLWNLTGGKTHLTDHSEASRTALFNLARMEWDEELLVAFAIPAQILPTPVASNHYFGELDQEQFGHPVPITAILGDQQAGLYGQACFRRGSAKNTFGTAGVLTANAGRRPLLIDGLTSSVAWTIDGQTTFEAEGVVFHSGQTLQWLHDALGLIDDPSKIGEMLADVRDSGGVYFVPAFAGLGAPYWDRNARATIIGFTLETRAAHIVRAAVEAIAFQTRDNVDALVRGGVEVPALKVDGGAAANDQLCQLQADLLEIPVLRPAGLERTALGVAFLAGIEVGMWSGPTDVEELWTAERVFEPRMSADEREQLYDGWQAAVGVARSGM